MEDLLCLGEAAVVDHRLQGAPLIKGYTGRLHDEFLCRSLCYCDLQQWLQVFAI